MKLADSGATAKHRRPRCVGDIKVRTLAPLEDDLRNLTGGAALAKPRGGTFMNAAPPGVIALFQPNDYYKTADAYLESVAEAIRAEYEAIVAAGGLLQIDAPDLAMGRHTMYRDRTINAFLNLAARHIEVLSHALRNIPADRLRMHVCWGNYEGLHHHDVPMEQLPPVVLKAQPAAPLFEAANRRHAHEWVVCRDAKLPDDKILIPGVLSTTTNYVEHPMPMAERLEYFADIVGRERVIAGSDCGVGTFAGFGPVDPDVAYLKLTSLVQGAEVASQRLWR
jgi:5-methyltetrahydropteroyltriglutamate--homocysteine methyltransferase